jgi:ABC-type sulfate/molybdate transport systems ATPase subunit
MRRQLAARIAADVAEGLTVVFASHDAEFLSTVARRVLVVDDDACSVVSPKAAVAMLHE